MTREALLHAGHERAASRAIHDELTHPLGAFTDAVLNARAFFRPKNFFLCISAATDGTDPGVDFNALTAAFASVQQ